MGTNGDMEGGETEAWMKINKPINKWLKNGYTKMLLGLYGKAQIGKKYD